MSAQRLREAARVLRERAEAAPPGPWGTQAGTNGLPADGPMTYTLTAPTGDIATGDYCQHDGTALDYASLVHPGVGLLVADLLDRVADQWSDERCHSPIGPDEPCGDCDRCDRQWVQIDAMRTAVLILGSKS